jgi:hypothetical protein
MGPRSGSRRRERLRNTFRRSRFSPPDQIQEIHAASLQVLVEIGMESLVPEARAIPGEARWNDLADPARGLQATAPGSRDRSLRKEGAPAS